MPIQIKNLTGLDLSEESARAVAKIGATTLIGAVAGGPPGAALGALVGAAHVAYCHFTEPPTQNSAR